MKIISVTLPFILLASLAIAQPQATPSDVCDLEYSHSTFHLYKGGKIFSANIPNLSLGGGWRPWAEQFSSTFQKNLSRFSLKY
jgi:hypothetical protein